MARVEGFDPLPIEDSPGRRGRGQNCGPEGIPFGSGAKHPAGGLSRGDNVGGRRSNRARDPGERGTNELGRLDGIQPGAQNALQVAAKFRRGLAQ